MQLLTSATRTIGRAGVLAGLLAGMLAGTVTGLKAEEKIMDRTVTVSASGQVMAEPDQAHISSGVVSEAQTARDALSQNTEAMKKVVAALTADGVDAKDIQTSSFNVEPVTVYSDKGAPPRITGYRVTNQVAIVIRNLDKLGGVLDKLVSVGANQVHGLTFEASKAESLKDDARKEAMANALRRAKLLASAGGAEVGKVLQISEEVTSIGGPMPQFKARAAMAEAVPVERGQQALEARVTVTWELK